MNVSPELLKRYFQNQCTPKQVEQVQAWLDSSEDEPSDLKTYQAKSMGFNIWQKLRQQINGDQNTATIPLYKKITRYAAAAFIIFAAFFGGRFSASTANASEMVDKSPKDHLFIFGGDGAKGSLPGETFKLSFDGLVRLYNGSIDAKRIHVGDTSFVLDSYQTYFLSGSPDNPRFLSSECLPNDHYQNAKLEGYFSILKMDIK